MGSKILVVDDEDVVRKSICRILSDPEFSVETFASGAMALAELQGNAYDLAITDLKMPGMNGIEVLKAIQVLQPNLPVIMITGYATVDTAVEAMKCGAFDYIAKPFTPEQILGTVKKVLKWRAARALDTQEDEHLTHFEKIIGQSAAMQLVYHRIRHVAPTDSTVLISGGSGTGKELVARATHNCSLRRNRPFVAVDCAALAENLLESELFGHVKGSFTGAISTKIGLFKVADGGTLFLDEISNLSLSVQAKLLRALQEREVLPIGSTKSVPTDIRLIAATNRDIKTLVAQKRFREDLFFRLNIIPINLPPLREREGDLGLLASSFLAKYAEKMAKPIESFSAAALAHLEAYDFPGNVRELENLVERAVVLCCGTQIQKIDLELQGDAVDTTPKTAEDLKQLKKAVREQAVLPAEKAFVLAALDRNNWNVTNAAAQTGMLRQNFQSLLRKHSIRPTANDLPDQRQGDVQEDDALPKSSEC